MKKQTFIFILFIITHYIADAQCVNGSINMQNSLNCTTNRTYANVISPIGGNNYNYSSNASANIVTNGDASQGMTGWNISYGTMGTGSNYFRGKGLMEQTIDLDSLGFSRDYLDCAPDLNISFDYQLDLAPLIPNWKKSAGRFRVNLYDSSMILIESRTLLCEFNQNCGSSSGPPSAGCTDINTVDYVLSDYMSGLRYIQIEISSCGPFTTSVNPSCACAPPDNYLSNATKFYNINLSLGDFVKDSSFTLKPGVDYPLAIQNADTIKCTEILNTISVTNDITQTPLTTSLTDTAYCIGDAAFYVAPNFPVNDTLHAVSFDGIDDWIHAERIENKMDNNSANGNYSLSMWVNTSATNQVILSQDSSNVRMFVDGSGNLGLGNLSSTLLTSSNITDGQWHHIGFTYAISGNAVEIFVDSISVLTGALDLKMLTSKKVAIGCELVNSTPQNFYNGMIDELRIWRTNIEANHLLLNKNTFYQATDSAYNWLALYYPFEAPCNLEMCIDQRCDFNGAFYNGTSLGNGPSYVNATPSGFTNALPSIVYQWSNNVDSIVSTNPTINIQDSVSVKTWYFQMTSGIYMYTDTFIVTVNPLPTIDLGFDNVICGGDTLDAGAGFTYLWNTGDTTQTIYADTTNNYIVTITDVNTCVNSDTINLTINPLPGVVLENDTLLCSDLQYVLSPSVTGNGPVQYLWHNNTIAPLVVINTGNYTPGFYTFWVKVTDANGCVKTDSITLEISTCVGINENELGNFTIYPNPVTYQNKVFIEFEDNFDIHSINAINQLGQKISLNFTMSENKAIVGTNNLPSGLYYLSILSKKFEVKGVKLLIK